MILDLGMFLRGWHAAGLEGLELGLIREVDTCTYKVDVCFQKDALVEAERWCKEGWPVYLQSSEDADTLAIYTLLELGNMQQSQIPYFVGLLESRNKRNKAMHSEIRSDLMSMGNRYMTKVWQGHHLASHADAAADLHAFLSQALPTLCVEAADLVFTVMANTRGYNDDEISKNN